MARHERAPVSISVGDARATRLDTRTKRTKARGVIDAAPTTLREFFRQGGAAKRARPADPLPDFIPWGAFPAFMDWRQGEHVTLIGQTGSGKTTLALHLLDARKYVCVLATKPRSQTFESLKRRGFKIVREWPVPFEAHPHVIFWPKVRTMDDTIGQRRAIADCLESIYESGGWTIYADELRYIADPAYLGLRTHLQLIWQQGRELDITMVGGNQRPAWVPLEAYSQASHLFFWREADEANLKRAASIVGMSKDLLKSIVPRLPKHEALYVRPNDGFMARTMIPRNLT